MADEMETFAARLASFDLVLHPEKRRTSSAKAVKSIAWPHRKPSPAELAHAGFYYNPYETNPDNTTCFLCHRALDGWEEEDNPITEHLKHANDCGWAVMMDIQQHSSNPAEIEDPTSDKIREARLATFGTSWPHDGKRGWVCQSEKMVDGGWYFCPTEESNDLASCVYCKLSLDGWEPKDDPFDEHYRRSADCSFFVFAQPPGKKGKGSRTKKARTSKASRLSTQSTASEAISELEDPMDQSTVSQPATKAKGTKKSSKSKSKNAKSKKEEAAEPDSQMDIDTADYSQPEPAKAKRTTRGTKRTSDQVDREQVNVVDIENFEEAEPPTKKRATKVRNSTQHDSNQNDEVTVDAQLEESIPEDEAKKGRGTTKKKASSKSRKASSGSSTSKTASKSRVPNDNELDAAPVADLEQPEPEEQSLEAVQKPSKKSKSKKKQKTTPEPQEVTNHADEEEPGTGEALQPEQPEQPEQTEQTEEPEEPEKPEESSPSPAAPEDKPSHVKSKRKSRGSNIPEPEPEIVTEKPPKTRKRSGADATLKGETDSRVHESFVSVEIPARVPTPVKQPKAEPTNRSEPNDKDLKKKTKQRSSTEKAKKSKKTSKAEALEREKTSAQQEFEPKQSPQVSSTGHDLPEQSEPQDPQEQEAEQPSTRRRSSRVPPKTAERYSDIPEEKQFARTLAGSSRSSDNHRMSDSADQGNMSPLPTSKSTPSLSPQSSDVENQPPSLKPSATRPPVGSPSKQQTVRIPLAPNTPSPTKRNTNAGGLRTTHPWNPIDIDEILLAGNSDKENVDLSSALYSVKGDLTSPEKKMSVEEWIKWHAKNGEEKLRQECERLVGQFEREGARAMRVLEGIECID
ncbi:putative chromosome segregation protein BIR1 [Aspergillus flavus]|uniref:Chromosome segregation protein BIR1 n=5 Tax=Aspergillus subgen. Circumdati TaxID=2720871 RepID=B8N6W7_ASPFN|nr:uncharacterized protein G4B84_006284 [Aspergillus flavus NRRL3357]KAJ1707013.1 chromosome segregation protein BIR1 [Aspergillus flavus]OOO11198.1 proteinase inhibitor I32 inhibitor of apoptosis repeat containing protein [Aspergillus oryzae]KAF7625304.1 hypothetical protein AFLA_002175 [Aspergillus flavus NRRL3357]QMW30903.1 hypothetical protein G4B84_006284 [Aspergillus flavus NRRL3357]QRD89808.1 putative chromosome segregation protein BIR1 [Aspergillus flavus]